MVYRFTRVASAALMGLVILRLTRLFLPTENGLPWPLVVLAAGALGAIITWAAVKTRFGAFTLIFSHAALFALFVFLYVGGDLAGTAVPPFGVAGDLIAEISDALTIFRYASPPVTALAGIVALAGMMVWALSGVAVWGLLNNAPYLAIIPPVVFYLQLAVIDRQPTGMVWTAALLLLVGGGLAGIAGDQRTGGGHAGHGRQAARIRAVALPALAVIAATTISVLATRQAVNAEAVPSTGLLDWTNRSGIGGGYGSISYNPFIDVRRSLVSNSPTPVFQATLTGDVPADQIYWRLLTMDSFRTGPDGDWWYQSRGDLEEIDETDWEDDRYAFRGETALLTQEIVIARLSEDILPAAYSPIDVSSPERIISKTTRVDPRDGALHIDGLTSQGMGYTVQSLIPVVDVQVLAADASGESLSPLFAAAAAEGRFPPAPTPADSIDPPRDLERYTEIPTQLENIGGLRRLAQDLTVGLETDYEKALALERYFRDSTEFRYSLAIAPDARDSGIAEWLLDDTSPGYHVGYCEQFSASMGVLARLLGIPTRTVLGFTPGEARGDNTVLVRDRNAHAWVEIWLPAQGWVRFDPTPRRDGVNPTQYSQLELSSADLDRYLAQIEADARSAAGGGSATGLDPDLEGGTRGPVVPGGGAGDSVGGAGFTLPGWAGTTLVWAGIAVVILGTVPAIKRRRRRKRLRRLEEGDISAAWAEIVDRLTDAGIGVSPAATPLEVATSTDAALEPLAVVYGATVYSRTGGAGSEARVTASTSLTATEHILRSRETLWQRIRRTYRVRSLLPNWIRRGRRG